MAVAAESTEALLAGLEAALSRADPSRPTRLVSATVAIDHDADPAAIAIGSRLAADRWFCWEQPDRGFAIAGIGAATAVISRGEDRFADLAERCTRAVHDRTAEEPAELPPGAGPVWATGFAFSHRGGSDPLWSSLPPALAVLPEISIARGPEGAFLTASIFLEPGTDRDDLMQRAAGRIAALRAAVLTPADPHPSGATRIFGRYSPERYEKIVAAAVERIRSTDIEKVVLARELTVEAPAAHDPGALFGALRDLFPSCFCFCFGTGQAAFLGASPELLVRRSGAVAATVALAGTSARSADPAVDDHLGEAMLRSPKVREEHGIVVRRIERALRSHAVWVHAESQPFVVKVGNLQHLATPIRAQLAESHSAVELAGVPASDACDRRRAEGACARADQGARGHRPRLVHRPGRLDGCSRGRGILRRPPLRARSRPRGAPVRRLRDRRGLGSRRRASGIRAQVRGAAAAFAS